MIRSQKLNADRVGMLSSSICLVHCALTPFIFIAKSCSAACCMDAPLWWKLIDVFFILLAIWAVRGATKNAKGVFFPLIMWFAVILLSAIVLNEHLNWIDLPVYSIYVPAAILIGGHFYNHRYCCKGGCCQAPQD